MSYQDTSKGQIKFNGLFLLVVLIAASNYVVCAWALVHVPPFTLIALRYVFAIAIISILIRPRLRTFDKQMLTKSLLMGLLLTSAVLSWQLGLEQASHVGAAAFIVSLDGVMVPIFAALLFKQSCDKSIWLAVPIAVVGLACLNLNADAIITVSDMYFVLSAVGFSLHILLTHRYSRHFDSVNFAWGQMWVVAVVSIVAAFYWESDKVNIHQVFQAKYQILYLAGIATALRFSLQNHLQKHITAATAGFYFALEPIFVALLGWIVLSEHLGMMQLVGASLIFVAVLLAEKAGVKWLVGQITVLRHRYES